MLRFVEVVSQELQQLHFSFSSPYKITARFGIYHYHCGKDKLDEGIVAADKALYQFKINGQIKLLYMKKFRIKGAVSK